VTAVVQDGVVVQVERTENIRWRSRTTRRKSDPVLNHLRD